MESEVEELQLWLEAEICGLQMEALTDLAKQLKVNTEGLRKLILSKKIREKMEQNVEESEDKKGLLLSFATLITGNPPPLEDDDKQIHVKDELAGQDEKPKEQTKETMSKAKEHAKLVQLVGQKCTVTCLLDGVLTEALWDTGAQVSILSHCWVKQHLPGNEVRDIGELLGRDGLALKAANGTDLPYAGWVEINFSLVGTNSADSIRVPFLVSRDALDAPIVGYNVIEEITKQSTQ